MTLFWSYAQSWSIGGAVALLCGICVLTCCCRCGLGRIQMIISKILLDCITLYFQKYPRPAVMVPSSGPGGTRPSAEYQMMMFVLGQITPKKPLENPKEFRAFAKATSDNDPVSSNPLKLADANVRLAKVPRPYADKEWDGDAMWVAWEGVDVRDNAPTIVWLHAGGIIAGSAAGEIGISQHLSRASHMRVLSVNYRLCPETPLPGATRDAYAAIKWLREDMGVKDIILGGGSGGAQLTLLTLQRMADEKAPPVNAALVSSPLLEFDHDNMLPSHLLNVGVDPVVPKGGLKYCEQVTCGGNPMNKFASPLHGTWQGLPPMLIMAGGAEELRDDAVLAYYKAKEAGVDVTLNITPNMCHCHPHFSALGLAESHEGLGHMALFARTHVFGANHDHLLRPLPATLEEYIHQFQGEMSPEGKVFDNTLGSPKIAAYCSTLFPTKI